MNWDLPQEAKQALELLGKWRPMDVEDSLELLSSQFTNPTVRRYAVARLQQADDEVGVGGQDVILHPEYKVYCNQPNYSHCLHFFL